MRHATFLTHRLCTLALVATATLATVSLTACSDESERFIPGDPASQARAADLSVRHLTDEDPALVAGIDAIEVARVTVDDQGKPHTFLRQTHGGVPVFGGEAIVHLNADGTFRFLTDNFIRGLRAFTAPLLSERDAILFAVDMHGGWDHISDPPVADLQVLRHEGEAHLTWRVRLRQFVEAVDAAMPVVFLDADTGALVWGYDALAHTDLVDANRKTYTAKNRADYRQAAIADSSDPVANDAHVHAGIALDYFAAAHNQSSFDNAGALVESYVHFDRNYVNAFWDGRRLTYGDGDGIVSNALVSLDVVAHELSHGVTEFSANLVYANESGALNEATSDIFAAAVEAQQSDASYESIWHIGEDIWLDDPNADDLRGPALRYMDAPSAAGDYDYYPTRYTGTSDNGGVHWNSGIANLFFHLLSDGGVHPRGATSNAVVGIGVQNAANIWYRALTTYMTSSTTFRDARFATVTAASDIDASFVDSVNAAWDAVGVSAPPVYVVKASEPVDLVEGATQQFGPYDASTWTAARFVVMGSSGDADLYVKRGSAPSTSSYDCASLSSGSNEACEFDPASPDLYYVMVHAWNSKRAHPGDVTGATLTVYGADAAPPEPECAVDLDCDDADACTVDTCGADLLCSNVDTCECRVDSDCDDGDACTDQTCSGNVCSAPVDNGTCCTADLDCDDGDLCTNDSCNADGSCNNAALVCDDGDSCTTDSCDAATGSCAFVPMDTCGGGAPGDACSNNSECASGNCRLFGRWANTCS